MSRKNPVVPSLRHQGLPRAGTHLEVVVIRLAAGGEGVAHVDGRVVFVRGGLPGDRLEVQVTEARDRFLRASLVRILQPGPDRREPPCKLAGRCGGCPWMALTEPAQQLARRGLVVDALTRLGGFSEGQVLPIQPAPQAFGWRNRARLMGMGESLGYREAAGHAVVDVLTCPILTPGLLGLLSGLRDCLGLKGVGASASRGRGGFPSPLQVELQEDPAGGLHLGLSGAEATQVAQLARDLLPKGQLQADGRPWREGGSTLLPFFQANHQQNRALVLDVHAALEVEAHHRLLDLFCGAGNFSLGLAGQVRELVGVENSPAAVARARELAPAQAHYQVMDAEAFVLEAIRRGEHFDRVVLDPPRGGAREVCSRLGALRPERVVYVSCDPATLARDLALLVRQGLRLIWVKPWDLMPQSAHVESVALLEAGGSVP